MTDQAQDPNRIKRFVEDLQKQLMWAREDADMRKMYLDRAMKERDQLRADFDRLEELFVEVARERDKWRNLAQRLHNPWTHMEAVKEFKEALDGQ